MDAYSHHNYSFKNATYYPLQGIIHIHELHSLNMKTNRTSNVPKPYLLDEEDVTRLNLYNDVLGFMHLSH
jgi:hypothetical protein